MASINELFEQLSSGLASLANAIRAKTGKTDNLTIEDMATEQDAVFDAGQEAYYDVIWDCIQNGGTATPEKIGIFQGEFWNDDTFRPKYDIVTATSSQYLFKKSRITDLAGILERLGKILDTSAATNLFEMFRESTVTHVPTIDARKATEFSQVFMRCYSLVSIEKLILPASAKYTRPFTDSCNLMDLTIEVAIGNTGFDVSTCTKLTHDSLMSIINALESKTSGTWTVTLGTTNLAKLTDAEKAIATQKGWTLA